MRKRVVITGVGVLPATVGKEFYQSLKDGKVGYRR